MYFIDEDGTPLTEKDLYSIIESRIETDKELASEITKLKLRNRNLEQKLKNLEDSKEEVTLDSLIYKLSELTAKINNYLVDNVSDDPEVRNSIIMGILLREANNYQG